MHTSNSRVVIGAAGAPAHEIDAARLLRSHRDINDPKLMRDNERMG